ncbi:SRPBCC family protein [Ahrensia marina]|uniref:Polyketide cyclase n=1 Tax=Ahrensia marina TaxID=1514904 RepID=A0A0M9GKI8_9HYPH|nr:SRPBCC domain-containing protein [Ahrensia marina]KPA99872.1 polyketide cyclase [Ahrensia marina]
MTGAATDTRTIIVERDLPHPPEKIWRALTQSHLISEWLMETDFQPEPGHRFNFSADWGEVACKVRAVKEHKTLEYSWDAGDLRSVVTWTLTPTDQGTRLRMEQAGFRMDQPNYYGGAKIGWPRFFDKMEQVLAKLQ